MASLKDDPKVQALVEKAATAATKAEQKRVISVLKEGAGQLKAEGDKAGAKALSAAIQSVKAGA